MTRVICPLTDAAADIDKAIDAIAFDTDSKQWSQVGIAIGQLRSLGERIRSLSFMAEDALWNEEQIHRGEP